MGGSINMEEKGCESIGCWTHNVTFSYTWPWIFMVKFWKKRIPGIGGKLSWTKGMWVNRKSDLLYDFEFLSSSMTLTFDFEGYILEKLYLKKGMVS